MKNPLISIIIPVFNSEKTLNNCLNSVLNQNYKNYEIIVIDNNSTDGTKKNKRIRYLFEEKKGRGSARNTGIRKAKGKIIAMIDSDCIASQDWIKKITQKIRDGKEKAVMGFEEDFIGNYWTKNIQNANLNFIQNHLKKGYTASLDSKNFAIESKLMKELMFDENLGNLEDYDLALRMREYVKVKFLIEIKVKHLHKNSFFKWAKLQFNRAYWNAQIYKKHKKNINFKDEIMMKDFSIKNNLGTILLLIKIFTTKNDNHKLFLVISAISWKLGLIWGVIKSPNS